MKSERKVLVYYVRLNECKWFSHGDGVRTVILVDPISCNSRHEHGSEGAKLTLDNIHKESAFDLDIPEDLLKEIVKQLEG